MGVVVEQRGEELWITFPYHPELVGRIKAMVPGRKWDPVNKAWVAPASSSAAVLAAFPGASYVGAVKREAVRQRVFMAGQNVKDAPQPEGIELELRPYQCSGVYVLSQMKKAILADDMGLGKTVQGIAWALGKRMPDRGTLVVCPSSVKLNWKRELERARPGDSVTVIDGPVVNTGGLFGTPDWIIVNYERLWRKGPAAALKECKFSAVIFDEAHRVKNLKSNQSKAALALAKRIPACLAMTGTPVENRPQEAFALMVLAGLYTRRDEWHFMNRYCVQDDGWGRNYNGAFHLDELHGLLSSVMVRRKKEDVLSELPPKIYSYHLVEKLENSADYSKAERTYIAKLNSPKPLNDFSELMTLKRVCALGKVAAMAERLKECNEEGHKAIVYSSFLGPIAELMNLFPNSAVSLTGSDSTKVRQEKIDEFTSNRFCRFVFTTLSEGINLQSASRVYFLDLPWTPAKKEQVEARAHRMGQTRGVEVINVLASNSIDERLARILMDKEHVIAAVVDGQTDNVVQQSVMRKLRDSYRATARGE